LYAFINYFPWTKWADEVDFVMFRAMLSSVIAGFMGRKVAGAFKQEC